jgi:hypothetical protein
LSTDTGGKPLHEAATSPVEAAAVRFAPNAPAATTSRLSQPVTRADGALVTMNGHIGPYRPEDQTIPATAQSGSLPEQQFSF